MVGCARRVDVLSSSVRHGDTSVRSVIALVSLSLWAFKPGLERIGKSIGIGLADWSMIGILVEDWQIGKKDCSLSGVLLKIKWIV